MYNNTNSIFSKNSFTDHYNLEYLVYYENFLSIEESIAREKEIKKWRREKKETLIHSQNPPIGEIYGKK